MTTPMTTSQLNRNRQAPSGRRATRAAAPEPLQESVSGSPRGRPKGALGKRKITENVLLGRHEVVENGEAKTRPILELDLLALRQEAFEGSTRAAKATHEIEQKYGPT